MIEIPEKLYPVVAFAVDGRGFPLANMYPLEDRSFSGVVTESGMVFAIEFYNSSGLFCTEHMPGGSFCERGFDAIMGAIGWKKQ